MSLMMSRKKSAPSSNVIAYGFSIGINGVLSDINNTDRQSLTTFDITVGNFKLKRTTTDKILFTSTIACTVKTITNTVNESTISVPANTETEIGSSTSTASLSFVAIAN